MSEQQNLTTPKEERQKQVATWIAGIFISLSLAFLIFSIYMVSVQQQGRFDLSDMVLMPLTVVMLGVSLVSFWLIRNGRLTLASWLLFVILVLVPPITAVLVLQDFGMTSVSYIVLMAAIMIGLVFPKSSRLPAVIATFFAILVTIRIEILDPVFRTATAIGGVANAITVLSVIGLLGLFVRLVWGGSLRTKLLVSFIGIAVLTAGVLSAFVIFTTTNNLRGNLERELTALAGNRATSLGNLINEQINNLTALSLGEVLLARVREQSRSYSGDAAAIQVDIDAKDAQWRAADAAKNNSDFLVRERLSNAAARDLLEYQKAFPDNAEIFITDVNGGLAAATNRTSDYNQADEAWWQAAYNYGQGAVYISDPVFDASSNTLGILLAMPLRERASGKIVGILRTTYTLNPLTALLQEEVGQTGEADIYIPGIPGETVSRIHEGMLETVDRQLLEKLQIVAGQGMTEMDYEGNPSVISQAVVQPLNGNQTIKNLGWIVAFHQDQAEAFAPVNAQIRGIIFVMMVVILLAALAAFFVAQSLVRPLTQLTNTAQEIAAGNFDRQAQVTTSDEIGLLASAFNNMTARLRDFINTLESRVAERTRYLELGAEVGRTVAQVRALDVMLKDATELIRKQFDLYYVQVYLTNPAKNLLLLEAGTGTVGAELVRQGHHLPLDNTSINGRAAVEKRSVVISDTSFNNSSSLYFFSRSRQIDKTNISDSSSSGIFRPNPLLPDTVSEIAIPLIVDEKVVGVLDLQNNKVDSLNKNILPGFEALAGQLAIAIQNASLLAETNQARAEIEAHARRLTHANWVDYLDAIHQPEEIGFAFEQNKIVPLTEEDQAKENTLTAPIAVTGEMLGNLIVEMEGGSPIARTEELINTVAQQVARQIESLRLLDSAERYRAEAEQASRRITHEGWQAYAANADKSLSYVYDLKEVRAPSDNEDRLVEDTGYILPLKVRDETVGKLVVQGLEAGDSESTALVNAVAERLGAHIESLRLTMQTEQALATTQKQAQREQALRQITSAVRGSTDPTTILRSAARELGTLLGRKTIVRLNTEQPKAIAYNGNEPVTPAESQNADGGNK
jgi:GAF domain-containing protein/HAMP domain-containing protein